MSAPERIWAKANYGKNNAGYWRDEPIIPNKPEKSGTEYRRADLYPAVCKREAAMITRYNARLAKADARAEKAEAAIQAALERLDASLFTNAEHQQAKDILRGALKDKT